MIIKILPIKSKGQLGVVIPYIAKDKGKIEDYKASHSLFHNLLQTDLENIQRQFESNFDDYARKRIGRNIGQHCILSLSPKDKDVASPEAMQLIAQAFIDRAYPNALAFAVVHDADNPHVHVIASSNELMSAKSTRLDKAELKAVHMDMLVHLKSLFPELKSSIDISRYGDKLGQSEAEYYLKKRNPELTLSKDELKEKVEDIFRLSSSSNDFFKNIEAEGFRTYSRGGETFGVYMDDRRMRFSRLGVSKQDLEELDRQNELMNERMNEIEHLLNTKGDFERGFGMEKF